MLTIRSTVLLLICAAPLVAGCDTGNDGGRPFSGERTVSAQANIFAAGQDAVPDLNNGGGLLPAQIDLPEAETVTFPGVTGTISPQPSAYGLFGPDGGGRDFTDIQSLGGIAGLTHHTTFFFLIGVFLTDEASASPPTRLDVTQYDEKAEIPPPEIGQTFFIGDGRSSAGMLQRFAIPSNATRLFVGFADTALDQGVPSFYYDNIGEVTVPFRFQD